MRGAAKIVSAEEAIRAIPSGATVAVGGFVGAGHPELLTATLEFLFLKENTPRDLTLVYAAGQGDRENRGLNHLAHPGLVKRVIGGHWNLAPKLGKLALDNEIEAYNFPQGVICVLLREIAAKRRGVLTKVGLNTFVDPKLGGGQMNARTHKPLVDRLRIDGDDWLLYKTFPIHVGLIRGTSADLHGNITVEHEGTVGDILPIAQAARNHGGLVIAQVERIVERIEDPKAVRVPGILVDYLVESHGQGHEQTFAEAFNESYVTTGKAIARAKMVPFSERKIIARRALQEIKAGEIVNLGIGLPETVAEVAAETGRLNEFTLTVESGPIGGIPASGLSFGCSTHPEAIIDQPSQFDFYDGGGIDIAVLGAVEVDFQGNVNVSSFNGRFAGVGGFVNIAQSAKRVVFCCTFRAGGLQVDVDGGRLEIIREGKHPKFVKRVAQICFHGPSAIERGQQVLYITERAVFELTHEGLYLAEVAPWTDLKSAIIGQMEFEPLGSQPRIMPKECFRL